MSGQFGLGKAIVYGAQNRGVADSAVVRGHAVDHCHGVEQAPLLHLVDERAMFLPYDRVLDVVVAHVNDVGVAAGQFLADDGGDLLRRPGRASTARETAGDCGDVEDVYGYGWIHLVINLGLVLNGAHGACHQASTARGALVGIDGIAARHSVHRAVRACAPNGAVRTGIAAVQVDRDLRHLVHSFLSRRSCSLRRILNMGDYTPWGIRLTRMRADSPIDTMASGICGL